MMKIFKMMETMKMTYQMQSNIKNCKFKIEKGRYINMNKGIRLKKTEGRNDERTKVLPMAPFNIPIIDHECGALTSHEIRQQDGVY